MTVPAEFLPLARQRRTPLVDIGAEGRPIERRSGNPFLNSVMQDVLRSHVPATAPDPHTVDIYYEEVRLDSPDDPVRGPYIVPLVTLRTNPCRWSASAACVMCGYHLGAHHGLVTDEHLVSQTQDAIRRLNPTVYPLLVFTSNGSFLDPAEVSDNVRPVLLRMLRAAGFRFLVTETRPEFITPRRLDAMVDAFTPTSRTATGYHPISISLGLESSNDFVRQYCINKGTRLTDYLEAFDILRRHRIHYDCYVLLGKLFVTAKEDVEDCVETIKFAVDNGADCVFVMVTNMVSYSLTSYLYGRGRYVLPSLWRAVELLERLPDQYRRAVQVKGVSHAPTPPRNYARTCDSCTEYVKGCLNFWNQTGEFEHIRSITECTCRDEFRSKEWAYTPSEALEQRVLAEYGRLAAELHVDPALIPSLSSMRRTARMGGGQ